MRLQRLLATLRFTERLVFDGRSSIPDHEVEPCGRSND
jgi:hypothetical protein